MPRKPAKNPAPSHPNIGALTEKMLHKRLYIIFSEPTDKAGDRRKVFPEHIAYQRDNERNGVLFAAGPFVDETGKSQGPGMIVVRAKNLRAAKRIADADPFHQLGYRRYRIQAWMVNEGGFSLRVNFSDGSFALD